MASIISFNKTIALSSNSQLAISFNPNRIKFHILLVRELLSHYHLLFWYFINLVVNIIIMPFFFSMSPFFLLLLNYHLLKHLCLHHTFIQHFLHFRIGFIIHSPFFYIRAIFIWQCKSSYRYNQLLWKWSCYFYNIDWANIDLFFNNCKHLFAIPVFGIFISTCVFIQKRSIKQQVFKWNRDKMILQLWAISSLYLGMWMPLELTGLIGLYWDPTFLLQAQIDYIYLIPYLVHLIYPFIVLVTYHNEMLNFKRNTVVVPVIVNWQKKHAN